jgi:hypothetical protein
VRPYSSSLLGPPPLRNAFPSLQPTLTRRISRHFLGTFIVEKLSLFRLLNIVSLNTSPTFPSGIRLFGLQSMKLNIWLKYRTQNGLSYIAIKKIKLLDTAHKLTLWPEVILSYGWLSDTKHGCIELDKRSFITSLSCTLRHRQHHALLSHAHDLPLSLFYQRLPWYTSCIQ